jgi:hypothetical protein
MTDTELSEFLATARKRFEQDSTDEKDIREEAAKDLRMEAGEQWDEKVKADREKAGRPVLTFPREHTFVQQVANEARQNKAQIKFVPETDEGKDSADIKEGLARHIQSEPDATVAYENAAEYAAAGSFGYYRIATEYCDDESWDQDIKIKPVLDPFSIYGILIPSCFGIEPDHAFEVEEVPLDTSSAIILIPKPIAQNWDSESDGEGWIGTETVRIAGYWLFEDDGFKTLKRKNANGEEETRKVAKKKIKYYKINGVEILPGHRRSGLATASPLFRSSASSAS